MQTLSASLLLVVSCAVVSAAPWSKAQADPPPAATSKSAPRVTMTVLADAEAVAPGSTFTLAVHCALAPGWHTYWPGVNDTGAQASIDLTLPSGWTVGSAQWPAPHRSVAPGDLLDHVLEGEFSLLYDIHVPSDAQVGAQASIKAAAQWMVCKDVCVIESREADVNVRVEDERRASSGGVAVVSAARKNVPTRDLPAPLSVSATAREFSARWEGATSLVFAPWAGGVDYPRLLKQGERKSDALAVTVVVPEGEAGAAPRVEGVLTGTFGSPAEKTTRSVWVSVPILTEKSASPPDHVAPERQGGAAPPETQGKGGK